MTLSIKRRRQIWERDGGICQICGQPALWGDWHADHIEPRMLGGDDDTANLRVTHGPCNRKRGIADRNLHGFGAGRPGAHGGEFGTFRIDPATRRRLVALAAKLELPQAAIVRTAVREMAERHGVENTPTPPAAPPASEE